MEWEDEDTLCRQLADADASLYFLILWILSVCLSWAATAIQRQGLYRVLKGEIQKLPDVFSLRLAANALVVGALTFFFGLALKGWAEADRYDPSACRAAETDLWASLFVLAAALLRLSALADGQGQAPAPDQDLPD